MTPTATTGVSTGRTTPRAADTPGASRGRRGNPWLTLVNVAFGVIMVGLDATVVAIANPYIGRSLHASLSGLQWVTNAYLLVLAVLLVPAGKVGDRYGRRLAFLVGVTGFAAASLMVGLSHSLPEVIAFRSVQGAFGALLMPNTLGLLRAATPPERLETTIGIWGGASAVAIAAGPIVGGLLVQNFSWQAVFYLNVPIGAFALAMGLFVLAESRDSALHRFDIPGLVALGAGLFALVFGVIKAQTWGWASGRTVGLLVAALVLLVVFALIESRVAEPLIPLRLFLDRSLSLGTVLVLVNTFALYGVLFFVTLYLQSVHGFSAVEAGVRSLPLTATFVVASPIAGLLTARFGPRVPLVIGMAAAAAGLAALSRLGVDAPYWHLWPALVVLGVGLGFVIVASTQAIVGNAPAEDGGLAGGIQSAALQLGGVLGTSVLGSVLASRVASVLVGKLERAGVPASVAPRYLAVKGIVATGAAPVTSSTPRPLAIAVTTGSHAAFMSGFHVAVIVAAVLAALGALAALFVRRGRVVAGPVAI